MPPAARARRRPVATMSRRTTWSFSSVVKKSKTLRPRSLARYMARSAFFSRSSGVSPWAGNMARPMDRPTCRLCPSSMKGSAKRSRMCPATLAEASALVGPSMTTTNSSPPRRATVSRRRTAPFRRTATSWSSLSPVEWPMESLMSLKRSRSMSSTAISSPSRRADSTERSRRSCSSRRLGRPVRASWKAWWRSCSSARFCSVTSSRAHTLVLVPGSMATVSRTMRWSPTALMKFAS